MTSHRIHPTEWPRSPGRPFVVVGAACVIGGGLISAAMAPAASYHSSWAVAYLVLVAGVAQAALGLGQTRLAGDPPRRLVGFELVGWNLGNAAVIAGTLLGVAPVLYAGSLLLVGTLLLVLYVIRHAQSGWVLLTTRAVVVVLLVSMPIGIVLQALDH